MAGALIQLNPSFKAGTSIEELVAEGALHPECSRIFKLGKETPEEKPLILHQHQEDAIRTAATGARTDDGEKSQMKTVWNMTNAPCIRRGLSRILSACRV